VIGFGGWGLETILHVWPRLHRLQEQRQALGIDGRLPDLDRLMAYAAILTRIDGAAGLGIEVVEPVPDHCPLPGAIGEEHARPSHAIATGDTRGLTEAETEATNLLRRVQASGYVRSLVPDLTGPARGVPDRAGLCRLGRDLAPGIVRALLGEVINPTRVDSRQGPDPFVRTTIYIVASLAEPHASALLWPVIAELEAELGARHIARVVAFLGTGSFAHGSQRMLEEAAVHVALNEMEALLRPPGAGAERLSAQSSDGSAGLDGAAGTLAPLFDTVYLVDRERCNQSLAQSPLELTTLVGNTLEALAAGTGADLVEARLAPAAMPHTGGSYSVVGAACDYVPLAEYLAAALDGEQKQIVRRAVLAAGPDQSGDTATLAELGAALEDAWAAALAAGAAPAFELGPMAAAMGSSAPAAEGSPGGLRIARDFLLPPAVVLRLRRAAGMAQWQEVAEARLMEAAGELEGLCDAAEAAWGVMSALSEAPAGPLYTEERTVGGLGSRAIAAAVTRSAEEIARKPSGLLQAKARAAQWSAASEAVLAEIARSKSPGDDSGYRRRIALWQREWAAAAAGGLPGWAGAFAGALIGLGVAVSIAAWSASAAGPASVAGSSAVGLAVGLAAAILAVWAGWALATRKVRGLKQRWISLAQERLALQAAQRFQKGLQRLYEDLYAGLSVLQGVIAEAVADLTLWAATPDGATGAGSGQLRRPHPNDGLWQAVRAEIAGAAGDRSLAEFASAWTGRDDLLPGQPGPGQRLGARVAALLEARLGTGGSGGPRLSTLYRTCAAFATSYLCPKGKLLADHPVAVRLAARAYAIEPALFGRLQSGAPGGSEQLPPAFLEDLWARAQPAANYEIVSRLARDAGDLEFGVTPDGGNSLLSRAAEQRSLPLLASHDPLAIGLVRLMDGLALDDLALTERCHRAYRDLPAADRAWLSLTAEGADQPD